MKDRIMKAMGELHSGVSFVELSRRVEGFSGDFQMLIGNNVVLWANMSEEMIDALFDLRDSQQIHFWPTSLLVYLYDGAMLQMPIAKRPTKKGYAAPHWLPSVINSGPPPAKYRRRS